MKRIALAVLALSCLGACGLKGDLERPPPLWGDHGQHPAPSQPENDSDEQDAAPSQP